MWITESESTIISSFEDYNTLQYYTERWWGKLPSPWFTIKILPEFFNCLIQVTSNTGKLEGIFANKNKKTELQEEIELLKH